MICIFMPGVEHKTLPASIRMITKTVTCLQWPLDIRAQKVFWLQLQRAILEGSPGEEGEETENQSVNSAVQARSGLPRHGLNTHASHGRHFNMLPDSNGAGSRATSSHVDPSQYFIHIPSQDQSES